MDVNPALCRSITWSGFAGAVDLYLDQDAHRATAMSLFLGRRHEQHGLGRVCADGQRLQLLRGRAVPGTFRVLARPAGSTGSFTQSASAYVVNDIPLLTITAPSDEGSADDFATTQLGNAWDMNATTDIAVSFNITGQTITSIPAETPAGRRLAT